MNRLILISFIILTFTNCDTPIQKKSDSISDHDIIQQPDSTSVSNKIGTNKDLLWTKQAFLAEWTGADNQFDSIRKVADKKRFTYSYFENYILASALFETDACGDYIGNIDSKNDTIKLKFELTSDVVCTSLAYYKVDYLINNPSKRKLKIIVAD